MFRAIDCSLAPHRPTIISVISHNPSLQAPFYLNLIPFHLMYVIPRGRTPLGSPSLRPSGMYKASTESIT